MSSVVKIAEIAYKRLEVFHEKLKGFCSSKSHFEKYVEINMGHIIKEGHNKNPKRLALTKEDIAAVIQQGILNSSLSNSGQGGGMLTIAVEGKINNFEWTDYNEMKSKREVFVQIRVIVRDRKEKSLVITAYVLSPPEDRKFPEVNREIW